MPRSLVAVTLAGVLATGVALHASHFPVASPNTPIDYYHPGPEFEASRDCLFMYTLTRIMQDEGWYFNSSRLGMPDGADLSYFPMLDNGQMIAVKLLTLLGCDTLAAVNIYYFATYWLTASSATAVLLTLGLSGTVAAAGGVIYALAPFHALRGVHHVLLAQVAMVPVAVLVLLWLRRVGTAWPRQWPRREGLACLLAAAAIPAFGLYYAYFFCYLLAALACIDALARRNLRPLAAGGTLLAVTLISSLGQIFPAVLGSLQSETPGVERLAAETEVYGLKLVQMLLPALGRWVPGMGQAAATYAATAPLRNENSTADLGLVIAIALVAALVGGLVAAQRRLSTTTVAPDADDATGRLTAVVLLSFLYGTVGGLGALVSFVTVPEIRSVNRIVVYLAFAAVAVGCLFVQRLPRRQAIVVSLVAVILACWDAERSTPTPPYSTLSASWQGDRASFTRLESQLPAGVAILQLPHMLWPEGGWGALEYDLVRPFLHTKQLRWSFAAPRGSSTDYWNAWAAAAVEQDGAAFIDYLRKKGFTGVLLYRRADERQAAPVEARLRRLLGEPTFVSDDATFAYFAAGS